MNIRQSDLFLGMSMDFVKQFMDIAERISIQQGEYLFHEAHPATHFYILIKGSVRLNVGEAGEKVYTVQQMGEIFGWSSLMNRDHYSASALSMETTDLLKISNHQFHQLLESDHHSGFIFFKKLSEILGNRLVHSYVRFEELVS
jgi:CRP-like cAMP-binding protein